MLEEKSIEQRIMDKFEQLQAAREARGQEGAGQAFDEFQHSIEILLTAHPDAYSNYEEEMTKLEKDRTEAIKEIQKVVSTKSDVIYQQHTLSQEMNKLDWDYREIVESIIMRILNDYHLIIKKPHENKVI